MRPEGRAGGQRHRVHAHDPVMEQVGLQHAPAVDARAVAERDEVGLGQPVASRTRRRGRSGRPASAATEHGGARWPIARTTAPRASRRRCRRARCARRTSSTAGARRRGSGRRAATSRPWSPPAATTAAASRRRRPPPAAAGEPPRGRRPRPARAARRRRRPASDGAAPAATSSTAPRADLSRGRRGEGAAVVGDPAAPGASGPAGCRATTSPPWPVLGAADRTATSQSLGTVAGRAPSSPSCRGRRACRPSPARSASSPRHSS